jgi:hypothetical protein
MLGIKIFANLCFFLEKMSFFCQKWSFLTISICSQLKTIIDVSMGMIFLNTYLENLKENNKKFGPESTGSRAEPTGLLNFLMFFFKKFGTLG